MTRRAAVAATLASATAVGLMLIVPVAGAATSGPDKTLPSPPSAVDDGEQSSTGIGIRAAATLTEFLPLANDVVGATGDVAGELASLARVPGGVLSPAGATITGFSIEYHAAGEYYVAVVELTSDATPGDAVTFFQATLAAGGFAPVSDTGDFDGDGGRQLHFTTPMSTRADAGVDVGVSADGDIELTITDSIDADVMNAFTGWAAGMPTLSEAVPIEASIRVTTGDGGSGLSMTLTTVFAYGDRNPDELVATMRNSLPDGGFSLDPADPGTGATIALDHVAMQDVTGDAATGDSVAATLRLSGTITI
jgi:hypothetical protein